MFTEEINYFLKKEYEEFPLSERDYRNLDRGIYNLINRALTSYAVFYLNKEFKDSDRWEMNRIKGQLKEIINLMEVMVKNSNASHRN